jgi:hypothetical protein
MLRLILKANGPGAMFPVTKILLNSILVKFHSFNDRLNCISISFLTTYYINNLLKDRLDFLAGKIKCMHYVNRPNKNSKKTTSFLAIFE